MRAHSIRHHVWEDPQAKETMKQALELGGIIMAALAVAAFITVMIIRWLEGFGTSYASFY